MTGTFINVSTVLLGSGVGALIGGRLPDRLRETALHAIGLMTLALGLQMALGGGNAVVVLGSVVLGALVGESIGIEATLNALGARAEKVGATRWVLGATSLGLRHPAPISFVPGANHAASSGGTSGSLFSKGFVTASLVFCVGPMTILGSFQDGLTGIYDTLAVKSVLDGFAALALASSLGWGVAFSALTVLVYQGALTLGAVWAKPFLSDQVVAAMTAAGGLLMVGIGLNILEIARIRVANMLPALAIAPALTAILAR